MPFLGASFFAPSLSFLNGEVRLGLLTQAEVCEVRMPQSTGDRLLFRVLTLGPHLMQTATKLQILRPADGNGDIIAVIRCANRLREAGRDGVVVQAPIALAVSAADLTAWTEIELEPEDIEIIPRERIELPKHLETLQTAKDPDAGDVPAEVTDTQLKPPGAWVADDGTTDYTPARPLSLFLVLLFFVALFQFLLWKL
jgi:hypothetical protein